MYSKQMLEVHFKGKIETLKMLESYKWDIGCLRPYLMEGHGEKSFVTIGNVVEPSRHKAILFKEEWEVLDEAGVKEFQRQSPILNTLIDKGLLWSMPSGISQTALKHEDQPKEEIPVPKDAESPVFTFLNLPLPLTYNISRLSLRVLWAMRNNKDKNPLSALDWFPGQVQSIRTTAHSTEDTIMGFVEPYKHVYCDPLYGFATHPGRTVVECERFDSWEAEKYRTVIREQLRYVCGEPRMFVGDWALFYGYDCMEDEAAETLVKEFAEKDTLYQQRIAVAQRHMRVKGNGFFLVLLEQRNIRIIDVVPPIFLQPVEQDALVLSLDYVVSVVPQIRLNHMNQVSVIHFEPKKKGG